MILGALLAVDPFMRAEAGVKGREHLSADAGLRFKVPGGMQVCEREIATDLSLPGTLRVHSLRILPEGVGEEQSLSGPVPVRIDVYELVAGADLPCLHRTLGSDEAGVEHSTRRDVGGLPATLRRVPDGGGGVILHAMLTSGRRFYEVVSGPRSEDEAAFELVLSSLLTGEVEDVRLADQPPAPDGDRAAVPTVRVVYLVPSDRVPQPGYVVGLERTIRHLQSFFREEIGSGETFLLHEPVVETVATGRPSSWYGAEHPTAGGFWETALADGFAALDGGFDDPANRYIFYIDADPVCGQYTGGTSGVALMPSNDLRGLLCQRNLPPCVGESPDEGGVCRWSGGPDTRSCMPSTFPIRFLEPARRLTFRAVRR